MAGELLLVFTQISSREPDREFVLGVRVPDSNEFEGAGPGRLCAAELHSQRVCTRSARLPLPARRSERDAGASKETSVMHLTGHACKCLQFAALGVQPGFNY